MGTLASIDLTFKPNFYENGFSVLILKRLLNSGWIFEGFPNSIYHLPLNDNDMFDWQESKLSLEECFSLAQRKENLNELVGFTLLYKNTEVGCQFLMDKNGELSVLLNINKQYIQETKEINFDWYINVLSEAFQFDKEIAELELHLA